MMNNPILDMASEIEGFKHIDELYVATDIEYMDYRQRTQILNGFELMLWELEDDITLQRDTLLKTLLNVKTEYGIRTKFRHTFQQMNAITLAIVHVRKRLKTQGARKMVRVCQG